MADTHACLRREAPSSLRELDVLADMMCSEPNHSAEVTAGTFGSCRVYTRAQPFEYCQRRFQPRTRGHALTSREMKQTVCVEETAFRNGSRHRPCQGQAFCESTFRLDPEALLHCQ